MNKSELIADLQSKVIKLINQPALQTDVDGVRTYIQTVLSPEGQDKANERNIAFIVVDEGQPGEVAYYRDTQHRQKKDRETAENYMGNLVTAGTIDGFQIETVEADLGTASFFIAKVWVDDGNGKLLEKRFHVSRDGQTVVRKEIL